MKLPTKWPQEIKNGNSLVRIYRYENKGHPEFKVSFYQGGKRKLETFADYTDARKRADAVNDSVANGEMEALSLSRDERILFFRAVENLKKVDVPLDIAAAEYSDARLMLGEVPLRDAVRFWVRNNAAIKAKTVKEVVDELINLKQHPTANKRPASDKYVADLRSRLDRFADAFHCRIDSVNGEQMKAYLDGLNLSGRTWFNHARLIFTLFQFAKSKKYFPREIDPFDGIEIEYEDDGEIEIFTPDELTKLFKAARPEIVPFLAIGAFAGLRHAEIARLDWTDIKADHIEVKKGKAKTRSRRLVPILPNLQAWLAPHRKPGGPVAAFANMTKQLLWLAEDARIEWRHNALRHSFISFRMASIKNENTVAAESGNSPTMIYRNYRELVTESEARAWFSIMPQAEAPQRGTVGPGSSVTNERRDR